LFQNTYINLFLLPPDVFSKASHHISLVRHSRESALVSGENTKCKKKCTQVLDCFGAKLLAMTNWWHIRC